VKAHPFLAAAAAASALALASVAAAGSAHASGSFTVVAAENFWGSIASQLAGKRASVDSIIVNPETDPHAYEPTPSDARAMATAKVAIVNGLGYDRWASQLIGANPSGSRVVIDIGDLLGLKDGDNPHQWYSPSSVAKVTAAIVDAYDRVDPAGASSYAALKRAFEGKALGRYHALIAEIRRRFAGVRVGYSESIFEPLAVALRLSPATPPGFAKAVSEGGEISAGDKETVTRQLQRHLVRVWVFNSQNATPDVERFTSLARAEHIPVATITETLVPASASFQQWQVAELQVLLHALERAARR
jgi:zinc/manganese transport system substrate-binding protein